MDKKNRWVGVLLVLFALAGFGTWAWKSLGPSPRAGEGPVAVGSRTVVYYFHTNYRCVTCNKFENYTRAELEADFSKPLQEGRLAYQVVNVEEPGNEHFIQDYGLTTKSIVLVAPGEKPRWKNLERIWDEVQSEVGFKRYIQTELEAFLAGAS